MNLKAPQTPLDQNRLHVDERGCAHPKGWQPGAVWWTCVQKGCKLDGRPIKEICKSTGQLFRHLRTCNHDQLQLSSKPSCTITTSTTGLARHSRKLSILTRNSTVKSRVSRTLSRTGLLKRRRWRRMERRIKREDTRRTITVLFVTLNKKTLLYANGCGVGRPCQLLQQSRAPVRPAACTRPSVSLSGQPDWP